MKPTIQRILVPTDFSPASDHAVAYASTLAAALHATIHLVHVLEDPFVVEGSYQIHLPVTPDRRERDYQSARARLSLIASDLRPEIPAVTTEVRTGSATEAIVAAAVDYGASLIVMGTHGRSGLQHLLLGSVAERVIRTARCPVLAVRRDSAAGTSAGQAA